MDADFKPLARSIGRADKFVRAWVNRELAPMGASVTEWILLFNIYGAPKPGLSQTEIAQYADMGGPALVRHLDRMERDGLAVRTRDARDRRITRVRLTDAGLARLEEMAVVIDRCDLQLRSQLTPREQSVLERALDKIFDFVIAEVRDDGLVTKGA